MPSKGAIAKCNLDSDRCNRMCCFYELSLVDVAIKQEMTMKTIFAVFAALFAVSAAGVAAEAHTTNGTHLMWINTPKGSIAVSHKNADCPNPPAVVK